jgi:hypothetical protein
VRNIKAFLGADAALPDPPTQKKPRPSGQRALVS